MAAKSDGEKAPKEKQHRLSRLIMRSSFLRGRYIKRLLKSMEKSKAKGKRLPDELYALSKQLDQMPKGKRAEALEQAMAAGPDAKDMGGRAMRRAAANQQRQSGRGGGRSRPGMGPMPQGTKRPRPR